MRLRSSVGSNPPHHQEQPSTRKIGTVLADEGFIRQEDIDSILSEQEKRGELFGATALSMGKINKQDLNYALEKQTDGGTLPQGDNSLNPLLVSAFDLQDPYVTKVRAVRSRLTSLPSSPLALENRSWAILGFDCAQELAVLASNLAIVTARMGTQTVAIDASYAAPMLDKLFRLPNRVGLSTLRDNVQPGDVAQPSSIRDLSVITTGPAPAGSASAMEKASIISRLAGWEIPQTQFIISMLVENRGMVAPVAQSLVGVDAVLLLARKNITEIADLREMIDMLDERKIGIAGTVIV